ncbi:hypothetical protein, partial [Chryseobacterium sp. S90]|uniref:hypothetical protein n=1 Tax=Chryseobacterium sp. S90 TaxID=3395373 RepID=UPI0039BD043E
FCFIGRNKFGNAIDLANERKYYTSPRTNLLTSKLQYQPPFNSKEVKCDKVLEYGGGALHLPLIVYADDKKYIYVDYMGLATPFCTYYGKNYGITGDRPGHFKINISLLNSQGYEESLIKNK